MSPALSREAIAALTEAFGVAPSLDDLPDGGAWLPPHRTIREANETTPDEES